MHGWVTHTDEFLPQPKFPSYYHHYTKVFHLLDRFKVFIWRMKKEHSWSNHYHSSPRWALVHIIEGTGYVTLDEKRFDVRPGSWVFIPPWCRHAGFGAEEMVAIQIQTDEPLEFIYDDGALDPLGLDRGHRVYTGDEVPELVRVRNARGDVVTIDPFPPDCAEKDHVPGSDPMSSGRRE